MMHHLAPKALVQLQRKNRNPAVCHPIRYYHYKLVFTRRVPSFVPGNRIITSTDQCRRHRHEGQRYRHWSPCCCTTAHYKLEMHRPWEMIVGYRRHVIRSERPSSWYVYDCSWSGWQKQISIRSDERYNILGSGPDPLMISNDQGNNYSYNQTINDGSVELALPIGMG